VTIGIGHIAGREQKFCMYKGKVSGKNPWPMNQTAGKAK
jgi:hypothetical protein